MLMSNHFTLIILTWSGILFLWKYFKMSFVRAGCFPVFRFSNAHYYIHTSFLPFSSSFQMKSGSTAFLSPTSC